MEVLCAAGAPAVSQDGPPTDPAHTLCSPRLHIFETLQAPELQVAGRICFIFATLGLCSSSDLMYRLSQLCVSTFDLNFLLRKKNQCEQKVSSDVVKNVSERWELVQMTWRRLASGLSFLGRVHVVV